MYSHRMSNATTVHHDLCDAYRLVDGQRVYREHNGPCRCRCGKPATEPSEGCEWHKSHGEKEARRRAEDLMERVASQGRRQSKARAKALANLDLAEIPKRAGQVYCTRCGAGIPYVIGAVEAHYAHHHRVKVMLGKAAFAAIMRLRAHAAKSTKRGPR